MHFNSLTTSRNYLKEIWAKNESIGSVHTLGALHEGHAALIRQSSKENKHTIVTIYPNKIQLFPGLKYQYEIDKDIDLAIRNGATTVISSSDEEMYPPNYHTFIDQGNASSQLNSSIFSYASRGQVTGAIRWINFTRPTRTYFGLKDIEQAILVKKAVTELLMSTEVVYHPCIRFRNGVPISSRLRKQPDFILEEVGYLYMVLDETRKLICNGEKDTVRILKWMKDKLNTLKHSELLYSTIVDTKSFTSIQKIQIPFIIHAAIKYEKLTHFDGLLIRSEEELIQGPKVHWL